jgi:hypothetical protein
MQRNRRGLASPTSKHVLRKCGKLYTSLSGRHYNRVVLGAAALVTLPVISDLRSIPSSSMEPNSSEVEQMDLQHGNGDLGPHWYLPLEMYSTTIFEFSACRV